MKERNSVVHNHNIGGSTSKITSSFNTMFKFSNNFRVSIALVPILLLLLYIGGKNTIYISAFTIFLVYISEYLKYQSISFGIIWFGLFLSYVSILFEGMILVQHSIINIILIFNIGLSLGLIGIWITIQFSWFTSKFSSASTLMERLLFGNLTYSTSVLLTWSTVVVQGIDSSPFYLQGYLFILYFLFGLPQKSFKIRSSKQIISVHDFILGRLDSCLMTLTVLFFPSIYYYSIYHNIFFKSLDHIVNILLLLSLSNVYIFVLSKYGSLWWLLPNYWNQKLNIKKYTLSPTSQQHQDDYSLKEKENNKILVQNYSLIFSIGKIFKIVSMIILVGCIEFRVILNSPTFYTIINNLSPKFGLLIVTIALYSFSAIFYFIFMGMESNLIESSGTTIPSYYQYIITLISCVFSIAISILLATPIYLYPISIISSYSLINYLFKKKSNSYLLFLISTSIYLIWFLNRNYLFIDFKFINSYPISNLSIKVICIFILALFVLSLLMLTTMNSSIFPLVSISQSIILTFLEVSLHSTNFKIYPTYFMILSSLLIIYINSKLLDKNLLSNRIVMISNSLMISKIIGLIFTPLNENILACFMITILFYSNYQPSLFEKDLINNIGGWNLNKLDNKNNNNSNSRVSTSPPTTTIQTQSNKFKLSLYIQIGISAIISLLFNNQITIPILNLFLNLNLNYNYNYNDEMTTVIRISSFLLTFGVSIIPICFKSQSPLKNLKNLNILIILLSILILIFNPTFTNNQNQINYNNNNNYSNLESKSSSSSSLLWTNWLLLLSIIIIVVGFGLRVSISKSLKLKLLFSFLFGSMIGCYICLNHFLKLQQVGNRSDYYYKKIINNNNLSNRKEIGDDFVDLLLNFSFILLFSLISFFLMITQWPTNQSSKHMSTLYISIISIFSMNYYLLGLKYSTVRNQSLLETTRLSLFGLYVGLNLLLSIYLKYHLRSQGLLESTIGTKISKSQYNYYKSPIKKDINSSSSSGSGSNNNNNNNNKLLLTVNSWIYKVGNISCITSYLLSIYIGYIMNFSEKSVFILSPILLLLFTETGWFKFLQSSHRYLPMVLSLSVFLLCNSFISLVSHGTIQPSEWAKMFGLSNSLIKMWWIFKNWFLFLFTIPSIFFTIKNLLKNQITQKQLFNESTLLYLVPITILSALFSDVTSIKLLGLIGLIGISYNIRNKILFNNLNNNINSL